MSYYIISCRVIVKYGCFLPRSLCLGTARSPHSLRGDDRRVRALVGEAQRVEQRLRPDL